MKVLRAIMRVMTRGFPVWSEMEWSAVVWSGVSGGRE